MHICTASLSINLSGASGVDALCALHALFNTVPYEVLSSQFVRLFKVILLLFDLCL